MIDSHCHLNFPELKKNFNEIILNLKKNNLTSILSINTEPKEFNEHLNLINKHKSIFISYGLHPTNIDNNTVFNIQDINSNCKNKKVIGIGETGLDFYHSSDFKKKQYEVFEIHIQASIENNLPIIIHQRNSENEIMDIIKSYQKNYKLSLVFHCFTGSKKLFNFCRDNNFYISLSGIVTFKKSNELLEIIKDVDMKYLLLETDSPFLAPVPMRGKLNEPSFIKYTAEFLSNFFNVSLDNFIKITDNNFYNLFSKAKRYINFE